MLFWNLTINLVYFTIGSIISLAAQQAGKAAAAGVFAVGSLATIILFGEMLPKSLGVQQPQRLAVWLAAPLRWRSAWSIRSCPPSAWRRCSPAACSGRTSCPSPTSASATCSGPSSYPTPTPRSSSSSIGSWRASCFFPISAPRS